MAAAGASASAALRASSRCARRVCHRPHFHPRPQVDTDELVAMSRSSTGGWLRGTIRKAGTSSSAHGTRSSTPQIQSTSTTIFGGGVKDATGKVSEYSVRVLICSCGTEVTTCCYECSTSPWMINALCANQTGISTQSCASLSAPAIIKCVHRHE